MSEQPDPADLRYRPTDNAMKTGIRGLCPRCQEGRLFRGYLKLAPRCEVCGLDFSFADPADGPAFFSMALASVPALLFAVWIQTTFNPPVWVHLFTSLPVVLIACLALLRPIKGWLVCAQYLNKAEQGRLDRGDPQS